ncbi:MAG TPA: cobalamin biosynthesis protein CobW [Afifellaceae bacterium]|nr:cobalamin biosynthesis protein CobW [Afifellaceae bacterium]
MSVESLGGRIPATIVTGFLGAGKTTLIRSLLEQANGRRIALIVNEFGDVGFDGQVLADCGIEGCGEDEIVELSNGCICCTVADDFVPAMEAILAREAPPEHIVIETSGLALPQPLVKAFGWPGVRNRVTVDGVVTVVDGLAVANGHVAADEEKVREQRAADESLDHDDPIEELFEDQLRCADLIVVSKSDLIDDAALERVCGVIDRDRRPQASVLTRAAGDRLLPAIFGIAAEAEADGETRKSHHEMGGEEDHEHDDFGSFAIPVGFADKSTAEGRIVAALALPGVLRIKGLASVEGKDVLLAVQGVGSRLETWFADAARPDPRLVVIGLADMDRAAVEAALAG